MSVSILLRPRPGQTTLVGYSGVAVMKLISYSFSAIADHEPLIWRSSSHLMYTMASLDSLSAPYRMITAQVSRKKSAPAFLNGVAGLVIENFRLPDDSKEVVSGLMSMTSNSGSVLIQSSILVTETLSLVLDDPDKVSLNFSGGILSRGEREEDLRSPPLGEKQEVPHSCTLLTKLALLEVLLMMLGA
ncbi:hypothetical protein Leryth_023859 [Lithospermum erythrorhizon]|nr:hypothetical protein Leryth_023859 [Lithospermum erythrorhizon]